MKLISCNIENFGILSGKHYDFKEGINVFCEENGAGKTTLAAFLKAMFYGLNQTNPQSLLENERKRYLPWSGGAFGGTLTFEAGGKKYRAERSFSAKASEDTFALYDLATGRACSDFSEKIGEELFGIDADGFERTVFLSEKNLRGKNDNPTVAAKLADLVGTDGDVGAYDDAYERLDKERKALRKRGGNGEIQRLKDISLGLRNRLGDLGRFKTEAKENEQILHRLEEERRAIGQRRKDLSEKKEAQMKLRLQAGLAAQANDMAVSIEKDKQALSSLRDRYPNGFPAPAEIDAFSEAVKDLRETGTTPERTEQADPLEEKFAGKTDRDELDRMRMKSEMIEMIDETKPKKTSSALSLAIAGTVAVLAVLLGVFVSHLFFSLIIISLLAILPLFKKKPQKSDERFAEIDAYLSRFDAEGTTRAEKFAFLRAEYARYESVLSERGIRQKLQAEKLARAERSENFLRDFCRRYPVAASGDATLLHRDTQNAAYLAERIQQQEARLSQFRGENAIAGESPKEESFSLPDESEILADERKNSSDMARLNARQEEIASALEDEDRLRAELSDAEEAIERQTHRLSVIEKTEACLKEARDALTSRYLSSTKAGFDKYVGLVGKESAEFTVDTSFSISKTAAGKTRDTEAFSRGTRDLYALAIRLALVDALYENEFPFLLFDDPFTAFDDKKCAAALSLLGAIAKEKQILYFTCSKSRVL